MKYLLLLLIFPAFAASDCGKKKKSTTTGTSTTGNDSIPACVRQLIDKAGKNNPPEQVDEYRYNGKTVYLVTAPCCDQYNTLYDENCQVICAPTGGITGKGDMKCDDFSRTANHVRKIWTKPVK